ncbi:hypothetical protein VCHC02C1_3203B, partial [Vibrio cholerae HC-02C1]
GSNALPAP